MNRPSSVGWCVQQPNTKRGPVHGQIPATLRALRPVQLRLLRIVLRGYYPRLQRPENIVHFFRDVCGDVRITPEVLARRIATYRRWLDSYTEQHRITVLTAPKGIRKEQVVAPTTARSRPKKTWS